MSIANEFLAEFEAQAPVTRKFLARVPAGQAHLEAAREISHPWAACPAHRHRCPAVFSALVDNNPTQAPGEFLFPHPASHEDILKTFADSVATVRGVLPGFNDAAMKETWVLKLGGQVVVEQPRADFLRDVMFSHLYQHRGQLSVYLRLLDIPVPSSWGPSADEVPNFTPREVAVA